MEKLFKNVLKLFLCLLCFSQPLFGGTSSTTQSSFQDLKATSTNSLESKI